jgi:anti-sigma regulatory factor (Ser/Thr protein kinase)
MELTLEAQPEVLAGLRRALGRWLMSEGVNENELFNITLAASEAAANSIEHAYGAREASFRVSCVHEGEEVRITVSDGGRWRAARPYGRGRGLAIMRALVDEALLERESTGTSVTLVKRLKGSSQ